MVSNQLPTTPNFRDNETGRVLDRLPETGLLRTSVSLRPRPVAFRLPTRNHHSTPLSSPVTTIATGVDCPRWGVPYHFVNPLGIYEELENFLILDH